MFRMKSELMNICIAYTETKGEEGGKKGERKRVR